MPPIEAPDQAQQLPPQFARRAPSAPAPRPASRFRLLIGALVVAAVAAGVTALLMKTKPATTAGVGAGSSASATASASAATTTTAPASPTPTPSPTLALGDPAADPIAYLEAMRGQIDGFIAQGQDTIDPNTGRDLQNSLADLQNAITGAQNNNSARQLRTARTKINDLEQKIAGDTDNGTLSQGPADQLTGELQNLDNALANN